MNKLLSYMKIINGQASILESRMLLCSLIERNLVVSLPSTPQAWIWLEFFYLKLPKYPPQHLVIFYCNISFLEFDSWNTGERKTKSLL